MGFDFDEERGSIPQSNSSQKLLGNGVKTSSRVRMSDRQISIKNNKDEGYCSVLNPDTDEELKIEGYSPVFWRIALVWIFSFLLLGLGYLPFYWRADWELYLTHKRTHLRKATKVLIKEEYKNNYTRYYVKKIYSDTNNNGTPFIAPSKSGCEFRNVLTLRKFSCKKRTYLWDEEEEIFFRLDGIENDIPLSYYHIQEGLSSTEEKAKSLVYGPNLIVTPDYSIGYLLVKEVLNPFYVFQIASVILWFSDEYYYYAAAIVIMSSGGIIGAVYQTMQNQSKLKSTIKSANFVTVCRGKGLYEEVYSDVLVPGDVIVIPQRGCELHCDAVLVSGNVIVNEAMLTGEAVPVTKTTLPKNDGELYKEKEHSRHTLYCGTTVIQTRCYGNHKVLAVVLRTGFMTSKGNLIRSIIYPPPVDFKFEQDSYKFVGFLSAVAGTGFIYTCIRKFLRGSSWKEIALDAFDLITITVPPALPAAMTIGSLYAQKRLKRKDIYCISPRSINVSGSVDCLCFDKTGTLTEDGLDLWGVVATIKGPETFDPVAFDSPEKNPTCMRTDNLLIQGMSSCHSLTLIDEKLSGDPLDLKMFESTGWTLEDTSKNSAQYFDNLAPTVVHPPKPSNWNEDDNLVVSTVENEVLNIGFDAIPFSFETVILREFPFSSSLQRMSVIVRCGGGSKGFTVFCKGSPEMILSLSVESSIPLDFQETLESYTHQGYRVIAMAYRQLPSTVKYTTTHRIDRVEVEKDLIFLGLIIMENRLKPQTKPVLMQLRKALIRSIMVTGDNLLTGLSVSRECELIPKNVKVIIADATCKKNSIVYYPADTEVSSSINLNYPLDDDYLFALDGKSFENIRKNFPDVFERIITRGTVFARMLPEQKQQLIEGLKDSGFYVGMCGDGANDCGALKAAHAGISLSDAESSVASPFTSRETNISCVPEVIREGRCALVTSFGIFKYMAAYSLTQLTSVMILYGIEGNLSDVEYLYIDLFLITTFAFFFGMTEAYPGELAKVPPLKSLFSLAPICSLLFQLICGIGFQVIAFYHIRTPDWFVAFNESNADYKGTQLEDYYMSTGIEDSEAASYENYAIFTMSSFQYIVLAIVFSKAAPYRKNIFSNHGFILSLIILTTFTIYLVLYPCSYLQRVFELLSPKDMFYKIYFMGLCMVYVLVAFFMENLLVEFLIFKKLRSVIYQSQTTKKKFLRINKELKMNPSWPPLSQRPISTEKNSGQNRSRIGESSPIQDLQVHAQIVDEKEAFQTFSYADHHAAATKLNSPSYLSQEGTPNSYATPLCSVSNFLSGDNCDDRPTEYYSVQSTPGSAEFLSAYH